VPGLLCTSGNDRNWDEKELGMARGKKHSAEQIVNLLRQIEVAIANGKTTAQGCKEAEITEQTYYRWRKEFGGLKVDQARRLKELEQENAKLKRLVSELSLEKLVLKDIAARETSKPGETALCNRPRQAAWSE
jgi:putative transposase